MQYLEKNRQASAPELGQTLNLTQANIRHHLDVLERDGKIEVVGELPSRGRGRPTLVYMAARTEQADGLDLLSSLLLRQSMEKRSPRKQENLLSDLAARLGGSAAPEGSITIRLSSATQYLNDLHYRAHWEAHADAPHIFLGHCPYAQITTQHPELCTMDKYLLEHLTGEEVELVEKQTRSPGGPNYCRFRIKPGS
jgi:predicted ArsR family transcriptional regulator